LITVYREVAKPLGGATGRSTVIMLGDHRGGRRRRDQGRARRSGTRWSWC